MGKSPFSIGKSPFLNGTQIRTGPWLPSESPGQSLGPRTVQLFKEVVGRFLLRRPRVSGMSWRKKTL